MKLQHDAQGRPIRFRRGKWVVIPECWAGHTVHEQTIRKRPSRVIHKRRKQASNPCLPRKRRDDYFDLNEWFE